MQRFKWNKSNNTIASKEEDRQKEKKWLRDLDESLRFVI